MADLFQRIEDRRDDYNVDVVVTFLEIYNEEIRDLLADPNSPRPRAGLSIREDKTVKVVGLVELRPSSAEEVKEIVLQGNSRRTQSPTHANETSSRSHAVLQVHVTQSPRTASVTEQRTMASLSIIDLAGSERAAATTNMGQRMVEGANINKSLLALGNCINALCESGGAIRHVPYRNSKLTRLLKFSLGGNCKTVMIVCIAPTSNHFDDTHNTLLYADRATKIKTKVVTRNVVNVDRHVGRYVEAINRLNIEVAELKAKLAGKINAEVEILRRKRSEANAEVERSKSDMKSRTEQTRASILDGATCSGKLSVAKVKLAIIRRRLQDIDEESLSNSGRSSQDIVAERALLQALASPEEQAVSPDSTLNTRLQRSNNSMAMFDATLRAVSERKSEKLDDAGVENVKADSRWRKAEMERIRAVEERDVMMGTVEGMTEMVVTLLGMLGRCTVVVNDAGKALTDTMEGGWNDRTQGDVKRVAAVLKTVKEKNDETFLKLVGHSTEAYTLDSTAPTSSLDVFKGYTTTFTPRLSSGPSTNQTRRSSSYGSIGSGRPPSHGSTNSGHSPRRSFRTPRKSLRSSLAGIPYKRPVDKEKKIVKTVQWMDEAGQGELDDSHSTCQPSTSISVTITSPEISTTVPPQRPMSLGGSESDWEDEVDKTDDGMSLSFASNTLPPLPCDPFPLTTSRSSNTRTSKRPRASRLDPNFLKVKSKASTLGILTEDEEPVSPTKRGPGQPLADRNVNQLILPDDSTSSSGGDFLHVPRHSYASPRKGSSMPRVASGKSGSSRRRSNIGPLRSEKGRRRSSMIPQLSPSSAETGKANGPRRVMIAERSPSKRGKRLSLLGGSVSRSTKPPRKHSSSTPISNFSILGDVSGNADISFNKSLRPTWR